MLKWYDGKNRVYYGIIQEGRKAQAWDIKHGFLGEVMSKLRYKR